MVDYSLLRPGQDSTCTGSGRVGFDVFGLNRSSITESHVNLMSYIADLRLPCMFWHHSYSSSSAEPSSSSMPQCGVHSSSGAKAICSDSNLFFLYDDE